MPASKNINAEKIQGYLSISGVTGTTISATTYQNLPTDVFVTGGTFSAGTVTFTNNTGGTFSITGFSGLFVTTGITASTQTLTTGFTYYGIIHTGNVDLTLPSPVGNDGFNLNIKDESGNSGIYRIRITTPSGSIDGNSYVDMNINYMSLHFVARNNNWWLI